MTAFFHKSYIWQTKKLVELKFLVSPKSTNEVNVFSRVGKPGKPHPSSVYHYVANWIKFILFLRNTTLLNRKCIVITAPFTTMTEECILFFDVAFFKTFLEKSTLIFDTLQNESKTISNE